MRKFVRNIITHTPSVKDFPFTSSVFAPNAAPIVYIR